MKRAIKFPVITFALAAVAAVALVLWAAPSMAEKPANTDGTAAGEAPAAVDPIVAAARAQVGVTVGYDPAYRGLGYPGGDVPVETGVCTDVVVRALRTAMGMDLQQLVHEDMSGNFAEYPRNWNLQRPDRNIDHRRVPNLQTYFTRRGWRLPPSKRAADYQPGDLVTCTVPPNRPHIMIVSDRKSRDGTPMVIHNIGGGAREEDRLFAYPLTGRYRVKR